jgi:hypothetical protein
LGAAESHPKGSTKLKHTIGGVYAGCCRIARQKGLPVYPRISKRLGMPRVEAKSSQWRVNACGFPTKAKPFGRRPGPPKHAMLVLSAPGEENVSQ